MTAIVAATPPAWGALEEALRQRRPVVLTYHGRRRCLSPHALGWKDGRAMLLAYQSAAETTTKAHASDPRRRWRNFFVDEVHDAAIAGLAVAWESADNYDPSRPFNAIDHVSVAVGDDADTTVR
jgi:predicted DNA-binding transcriptional regulator YafY